MPKYKETNCDKCLNDKRLTHCNLMNAIKKLGFIKECDVITKEKLRRKAVKEYELLD